MTSITVDNATMLFDDLPRLIPVKLMSEETGQSEQTIRALMRNGEIPSCRIGRRLYCPRDEFERFVRAGGGRRE